MTYDEVEAEKQREKEIKKAELLKGAWLHTQYGNKVRPLEPETLLIDMKDVTHALANICRFTGHVDSFYSVAEHSVRVLTHMRNCEPDATSGPIARQESLGRWALLHDASEAYLTDIAAPLKRMHHFDAYRDVEQRLTSRIVTHFGLSTTEPAVVRRADIVMCVTEAVMLFKRSPPTEEWLNSMPDPCKACMKRPFLIKGQTQEAHFGLLPHDARDLYELACINWGLL